ncbi:hypothetical protein AY600_14155 [Phormidium willei BDU 130791]|nr:hypothetical protein AY600_14155 [Phormidium willei BDU 130791]
MLRIAAVLAAPLLLSGCGVWDEFFGEEPQPTRVQVPAESAEAETPSLGAIPQRRDTSPGAQRQALRDSLAGDRARAEAARSGMDDGMNGGMNGAGQAVPPQAAADVSRDLPPAPSQRAGFERQPASVSRAPQMSAAPQMQQMQRQAPQRRELVGVIYFAHGSANLDNRDREVLRQVRDMLRDTGGQLRVAGHASMRTGVLEPARHAMANLEISQQRAAAVANELNRQGVPDSALAIEAFGAQQPVYYEFMPTGEAGNRRVEVYLEY